MYSSNIRKYYSDPTSVLFYHPNVHTNKSKIYLYVGFRLLMYMHMNGECISFAEYIEYVASDAPNQTYNCVFAQ